MSFTQKQQTEFINLGKKLAAKERKDEIFEENEIFLSDAFGQINYNDRLGEKTTFNEHYFYLNKISDKINLDAPNVLEISYFYANFMRFKNKKINKELTLEKEYSANMRDMNDSLEQEITDLEEETEDLKKKNKELTEKLNILNKENKNLKEGLSVYFSFIVFLLVNLVIVYFVGSWYINVIVDSFIKIPIYFVKSLLNLSYEEIAEFGKVSGGVLFILLIIFLKCF